MFPKLVTAAFQKRKLFGLEANFALDVLLSFLSDCIYPAKHIDSALIEAFGQNTRLVDCSFATRNNIHVAIPVTTTRESALCLFTSYNGITNRREGDGHDDQEYHVIKPGDEKEPVKVWEV